MSDPGAMYRRTFFIVEWQRAGGPVNIITCRTRAIADAVAFEMASSSPQPRIWMMGEVVQPGEYFSEPALPRPGARGA
jgi:hypothetical protein